MQFQSSVYSWKPGELVKRTKSLQHLTEDFEKIEVIENLWQNERDIPDTTTVYTAELFAIETAIDIIKEDNSAKRNIYW